MGSNGNKRYFVLVGLLLATVVAWQFGTHEGTNINPLDDSDTAAQAAPHAVRVAPSTPNADDAGRFVERHDSWEAAARHPEAYVADQVMVRVEPAMAATVAHRHGTTVVREPGISGYAALAVPQDSTLGEFSNELLADAFVLDAAPIGRIFGAGDDAVVADYQWHIDGVARPADTSGFGLSNVKVAVLDTGLAYEDHAGGVGLPSLDNTNISDPWDYVNDDAKPYDDHQHGSHIASVIASQDLDGVGEVTGVAPEVTLMPIKVLDQNNAGTELYLLDALAWAVEKDADVINMSLSFAEGYVGSRALSDALDAAWDTEIVTVAAAGNQGLGIVTWPAAHKRVIAVGATAMKNKNHTELADYSNDHPRVDLVAPGGAIGADRNHDDVDDGVLAQTIALNDPNTPQYVLYAGTSQATAMVSAAAAYLLSEGVHPRNVRHVLQRTASRPIGELGYLYGTGAGCLDIEAAVDSVTAEDAVDDAGQLYVALLPFLRYTDETHAAIEPVVQVSVVDDTGTLVPGAEVYGTWAGTTGNFFSCITDAGGQCVVEGTAAAADTADMAWAVEVPTVTTGGVAYHPDAAFFADDDVAIILAAMADEPEFDGSLLAFYWDEEVDADLGDLVEAYFVIDTGVGLGSCPLGIIFPPRTLGTDYELAEFQLDLDGTGLGSCPLGLIGVRLLTIQGGGLGSCPLGLPTCRTKLGGLGGGGLGSCPLGKIQRCFLGPGGSGNDAVVFDFGGEAVLLGSSATSSVSLEGTPYGDVLGAGGWVTDEGEYGGASAVTGSGGVVIVPPAVGMAGAGAGSLTFVP
jgi:subtilisin family serine protease